MLEKFTDGNMTGMSTRVTLEARRERIPWLCMVLGRSSEFKIKD
uniref:Uncharacterized protein n=1 Tax=Rhizophora mucronata TaxID=61149 RepID=A0A2P2J7V6_RHIMU